MNQDPVRVGEIHWTRVFPFLRLTEAAGLGCGLSSLILAYACVVVAWSGSLAISYVLSNATSPEIIGPSPGSYPSIRATSVRLPDFQDTGSVVPVPVSSLRAAVVRTFFDNDPVPLFGSVGRRQQGSWSLPPLLMLWNALVIGFFGTAIARSVTTDFCLQSRTGVVSSAQYAWRHKWSTLLATGLVAAFLTGLRILLAIPQLLAHMGAFGDWIVSMTWGFALLLSIALALIFIIGGLAWLLSLGATGTDGCTGAEGLSRSISYVLSHPIRSGGGVLVVIVIAGLARWLAAFVLAAGLSALPSSLRVVGKDAMLKAWVVVLDLVPMAVHLSVFLAGIAILYVLLRHREDGITIEEVDGAVS